MNDANWDRFSQAIADHLDIAWDDERLSLSGPDDVILARFKKLQSIVRGFRTVDPETPQKAPHAFTWGHLEVLEKLGQGSYGEVYRALDPILDREVALKLRLQDRTWFTHQQFMGEARRLAQIRHPNVLGVYGVASHGGRIGLWCDLIEGQTLYQRFRKEGPFATPDLIELGFGLCSGLEAVHHNRIIHGDVKPSNVMRADDGRILLMDFGTSAEVRSGAGHLPLRGTPPYLAPEIVEGKPASTQSDIFSVGVLLYFLATGQHPFEAGSLPELAALHRSADRKHMAETLSPRPTVLKSLILDCLKPDPRQRPDAAQLVKRFNWILNTPLRRKSRLRVGLVMSVLTLGTLVSFLSNMHALDSEKRARTAQRETQAVNQYLFDILAGPRRHAYGKNTPIMRIVDEASARMNRGGLADRTLVRARTLAILGKTYYGMSEFEKARPHLEEAWSIQKALLGYQHPEALLTQGQLCFLFLELQQKEKAHKLLMDLQQGIENQKLKPQPELNWTLHMGLGKQALFEGNTEAAESYFLAAAQDMEGNPDQAKYFGALSTLAAVKRRLGHYADARATIERCISWAKEKGSKGHQLDYQIILSSILSLMERLDEAEVCARDNVHLIASWLGPDAAEMISAKATLSNVLYQKGEIEESTRLNEDCLVLARKWKGPGSSFTLNLMGNQANRLMESGLFDRAEAQYLETLAAYAKFFSPTHPDALLVAVNLSELYLKKRDWARGLEKSGFNLPLLRETVGKDHLYSLYQEKIYGALLLGAGRLDEALERLASLSRRAGEKLGSSHSLTLDCRQALGEVNIELGRFEEGWGLLEDVLQKRLLLFPDHPDTAKLKLRLERRISP